MINLSKSGDTIVFEFINNGHYLENGTIEVPVNSLSLVIDSSNMATFYKADSGDIFISATYDELGKTKAEMLEWYEENMVDYIDSGDVQTQIDESVSGFADSVLYNSTSKYVEFYNGGTGGTLVYEFDASDFVIDGMIDDVRIETISGVSYLVIDFNTASGKEDIQIPLTDIFNPSDYYTTAQTDTKIAEATSGKADTTAVTESISQAVSGKQDTLSAGTGIEISGNVISATGGGGKAIEAGRGIDITTGATADTVSFNLPISAGTGGYSLKGNYSSNNANGAGSCAFGYQTLANNQYAFAIGQNTKAYSKNSFAGGHQSESNGSNSFSFGIYAKTKKTGGALFGLYTLTNNEYEFGCGSYNVSTSASTTFGDSGNTLFSIGNGTADNARHNAFEIRQNGDIYYFDGTNDVKLQDKFSSLDTTIGNINSVLNSI